MTHAESGTLLSYLDGQLTGPEASTVEVHLAACERCREALEEVRSLLSEVSGALNLVASDPPLVEAHARFRAHQAETAGGLRKATRPWRFATSGLLKAAAVVLLLAGAAAAAIPGSPVRRWAEALLDRIGGPDQPEVVETVPLIAEPTPEADPGQTTPGSEIFLPVQDGRVRVSIRSPDPTARFVVRLVDGQEGFVQALDASDQVRVQTGTGYAEVFGVQAGAIIQIPRSLRTAVIDVDGLVFWEKDGLDVRTTEFVEESGNEFVYRGRS